MKTQKIDANASLRPTSGSWIYSDLGGSQNAFAYPAQRVRQDKQAWVWAFADALMSAANFKTEHMDALDVGYRIWQSEGWRNPVEIVAEYVVGPDGERF
jgi:hypothetical protein